MITGCKQLSEGDEEATEWDLGRCVSKLEDCLREVLSDVLEVEMKAAYEDLWQEVKLIVWNEFMCLNLQTVRKNEKVLKGIKVI